MKSNHRYCWTFHLCYWKMILLPSLPFFFFSASMRLAWTVSASFGSIFFGFPRPIFSAFGSAGQVSGSWRSPDKTVKRIWLEHHFTQSGRLFFPSLIFVGRKCDRSFPRAFGCCALSAVGWTLAYLPLLKASVGFMQIICHLKFILEVPYTLIWISWCHNSAQTNASI